MSRIANLKQSTRPSGETDLLDHLYYQRFVSSPGAQNFHPAIWQNHGGQNHEIGPAAVRIVLPMILPAMILPFCLESLGCGLPALG